MPDYLKIGLFRIAQEAMNNIGKHASATRVHLGLRKVEGQIELTIRDNGEGFDPESLNNGNLKKGLGLASMKERAEFSGGSFCLESVGERNGYQGCLARLIMEEDWDGRGKPIRTICCE